MKPGLKAPKEKRKYQRVPSSGHARFMTINGPFSGEILDISPGGMMFRTEDHLGILEDLIHRPEDFTLLSLTLPSGLNLMLKGVMVWTSSGNGRSKRGAVRFSGLSDNHRARLLGCLRNPSRF